MNPHVNETAVRDRIHQPVAEAARRRLARTARTGEMRRAGLRSLREAVGHRLTAIGSRLVEPDPTPDPSTVGRAA